MFFCRGMIYQNVLRNKLRQMTKERATSVLKTLFSLKPRRPRIKDAKGKFRSKMLSLVVSPLFW